MFTGIIEGLGTITGLQTAGTGKRMTIDADFELDRTKIGDSIAVNGACLTAVSISGTRFAVDVAPETISRTVLGQVHIGEKVNLERALRLSDRLDGHLVSGHIDGTGRIESRTRQANAVLVSISVPEKLSRYMIEKGSVAVDGISLTINACRADGFDVSIIPHTAKLTTVGFKPVGAAVNIETDMIGKYVEKFLSTNRGDPMSPGEKRSGVDMKFLAETGFI